MINQEDLVLKDIKRCKKIQPIMERLGIEEDGYYCEFGNYKLSGIKSSHWSFCLEPLEVSTSNATGQKVKTYRQDKLAWALPDWLKEDETGLDNIRKALRLHGVPACKLKLASLLGKIIRTRDDIINAFRFRKGSQIQLEATADLLILLDGEGLL